MPEPSDEISAIVDYGNRLKMRKENELLYKRLKSFFNIQVRNIIIILIVLYYFRSLILQNSTKYDLTQSRNIYTQPRYGQQHGGGVIMDLYGYEDNRLLM